MKWPTESGALAVHKCGWKSAENPDLLGDWMFLLRCSNVIE